MTPSSDFPLIGSAIRTGISSNLDHGGFRGLLKRRSASSRVQGALPGVSSIAAPAAIPSLTALVSGQPRVRPTATPATIASPVPTPLPGGTSTGGKRWPPSGVASRGPVDSHRHQDISAHAPGDEFAGRRQLFGLGLQFLPEGLSQFPQAGLEQKHTGFDIRQSAAGGVEQEGRSHFGTGVGDLLVEVVRYARGRLPLATTTSVCLPATWRPPGAAPTDTRSARPTSAPARAARSGTGGCAGLVDGKTLPGRPADRDAMYGKTVGHQKAVHHLTCRSAGRNTARAGTPSTSATRRR